jgi:hypothetical protein
MRDDIEYDWTVWMIASRTTDDDGGQELRGIIISIE